MLCGWEGNRRSGIALAMRHRLRGLSTYGLNGHCVGDEHLTYAFGERHLYLYMPVPMRYASQHMEQQDVAVLD